MGPFTSHLLEKSEIYNVIFHYNSYNKSYNCLSRDNVSRYFNGAPKDKFSSENEDCIIGSSAISFDKAFEDYLDQKY